MIANNRVAVASKFLLFVAATIVLSKLWGNGFTSGDEGYLSTARMRFDGIWAASVAQAISQSRFYNLLTFPLVQLPYAFDSLAVVNAFRIASSAFPFFAFFFFCYVIWGEAVAAIVGAVGLGVFQTVGGAYNPFHGLALWFNLGAGFLCLSLTAYGCAEGKFRRSIAAVLIFLTFLFYEPFLLYFPYYVLIREWRLGRSAKALTQYPLRRMVLDHAGLICSTVLYLMLYVSFSRAFPSQYEGKSLSLGSLPDMLYTVWAFSLNGIHHQIYAKRHLLVLDLRAAALTALVVLIAALNFIKIRTARQTNESRYITSALVLIPAIFLPNLLFAFTERYRNWVRSDPYYLGSYYSGFALCLFIGLLVSYLALRLSNTRLRTMPAALLLFVFAIFTYTNQVASNQFFDLSRVDSNKWTLGLKAAEFLKSSNLAEVSLCSDTLVGAPDAYDYWSYFFSYHAGKKVRVIYSKSLDPACNMKVTWQRYPSPSLTLLNLAGSPIQAFSSHL